MATSTKESLGNALKKMLTIKPIDKITVKDLVEECGEVTCLSGKVDAESSGISHEG